MRALIIDDSRAMRSMLGRILRGVGYEVVEACQGLEGLQRLREGTRPDIVLVDWNMPVMSGVEFVKAVRSEAIYDGVRLMLVTAETDVGRIGEALSLGADEYVMKPFTKDLILAKLGRLAQGTKL